MLSLSLSIPALGEDVEDSLPFCGIVVPTWDRQIRDFPSAFLGHFGQQKYTFRGFDDEKTRREIRLWTLKSMKQKKRNGRGSRVEVFSIDVTAG